MLCCEYCFDSKHKYLIDFIRNEGERGECEFCGSSDVRCVDAPVLKEVFEPLLNIYTDVNEFMSVEEMKELDHWEYRFSNHLNDDWNVFSELAVSRENFGQTVEDFLVAVFSNDENNLYKLDHALMIEQVYYGDDHKYSDEVKQNWEDFRQEIIAKNRFFPQCALDLAALEELFSVLYVELKAEGAQWYRARKVTGPNPTKFECAQMQAPPAHLAFGQRANPLGIPYLYLASDAKTCIVEIRPEITDRVTIARFSLTDSIKVVDLSGDINYGMSPFGLSERDLFHYLEHLAFLDFLKGDISKPYNSDIAPLEYIPTQYLIEFIKHLRYDGVLYSSSLTEGTNLVIFNQEKVECIETKFYEITAINLEVEKREV
jgi:hypothetical protein